MNKLRSILVCSFIFISIQISWCQNYLYSNEAPDVYRKDNSCVIAENYLKEKFIPKGWKYSRISAAAYKFPNGNKLIVINGVTSYTEKQELYSENGWLTNEGYTNHVSKLKENEENIYYAIVVSASGEAIKAIKVCPRFAISVLNDDRFLIIAGNPSLDEDTEYKSYYTYHNILCFSNNTGKEIWAVRNYGKMRIYDYTSIGNNLLIVGNSNGYSCYKMIDIKTGKVLEEKTVAHNSTYIKVSCDGSIIKVEERIDKNIYTVKLGEHYSNGNGQLARKTEDKLPSYSKYSPEEYKKQTKYVWLDIEEIESRIKELHERYKRLIKVFGSTPQRKRIVSETIQSIEKEEKKAPELFATLLQMAKDSGLSDEIERIQERKNNFFNNTGRIKKQIK